MVSGDGDEKSDGDLQIAKSGGNLRRCSAEPARWWLRSWSTIAQSQTEWQLGLWIELLIKISEIIPLPKGGVLKFVFSLSYWEAWYTKMEKFQIVFDRRMVPILTNVNVSPTICHIFSGGEEGIGDIKKFFQKFPLYLFKHSSTVWYCNMFFTHGIPT